MATPDITKTWQIAANGLTGTSYGSQLYLYKQALCGFSQNPWQVVLSSDASTAGAGDKWTSSSAANNSVTSTGARSWAVLQNVTGMQILLDYVTGGNGDNADFRMSPRGLFTGGTTSSRPTATDEIPEAGAPTVLGSNPYHKQWTHNATAKRFHVWHTTDGKQSMLVAFHQSGVQETVGTLDAFWILGQAEQAHPAWSKTHVMFIGVQGNSTNPNNLFNSNDWVIAEDTQGKYQLLTTTAEGEYDGTFQNVIASYGKNQISNTYPTQPFTLWSGKYKCKIGRWPVDVYGTFTDTTGYTTGDFVPADGSNKFVKVNGLLLPWDGVTTFQWNS